MAEWRIEGQVWIEDQLEGLHRHADRVAGTRREMEASADRLAPMWEELERALSGKAAATVPSLRDLAEARSKRRRDLMAELEALARPGGLDQGDARPLSIDHSAFRRRVD